MSSVQICCISSVGYVCQFIIVTETQSHIPQITWNKLLIILECGHQIENCIWTSVRAYYYVSLHDNAGTISVYFPTIIWMSFFILKSHPSGDSMQLFHSLTCAIIQISSHITSLYKVGNKYTAVHSFSYRHDYLCLCTVVVYYQFYTEIV